MQSERGWTRRDFLEAAAMTPLVLLMSERSGTGSEARVKIDRVEVFPARYPMTGHFKFFTGPHGREGRAAVFVKITASDGTVGWGQSVPIARWSYETLETSTIVLEDYYAPLLIGKDPADIAGIHALMDEAIAMSFTTGMPIARAGIDIALWDLVGKLRKKPLAALWGREPGGRVKLSRTVNPRTLDEVDGLVEAGRERGCRDFNIKVAPDPELAAALVLYAAFDLETPAALNGPQFLSADVLAKPLVIADGFARAPSGPGLGIEVDEAKVAELVARSRR